MTCPICGDRGIVRVRYRDGSPDAYGVCLCAMGQAYRDDRNARRHTGYPQWMLWAARNHVPQEQVCHVEDLLDDDELARIPRAAAPKRGSAIAAALQTKRPKL